MKNKLSLIVFIFFCVSNLGFGQINIIGLGAGNTYTQDFNTLANTLTSAAVPSGWSFFESGTNANTIYTAGTGISTTGDTFSFGSGINIDRSFGGLQSNTLNPTIGVNFINNTGYTINELNITYYGEQWRLGAIGREDRLDFQYSTSASSLTTGTWVDVNNLDFIAPMTSGTVGALNGNLVANRTLVTYTITGLSITNGSSFWLRWTDFNATGADDGLGVDDFSFYANGLTDDVDWSNLQSPSNGTIDLGNTFNVYARAKENGVTNGPGQGAGLLCWIGYSTSNTNPSTWTNWIPATFIGNFGNNDEFMVNLGSQISSIGTYYYASKFQLNGGPYSYGGYNAGGGGFWDDIYGSAPDDNESGQLIINARTPDWVNLQSPGSTNSISTGSSFFVYAQIYEPGITENSPATPGTNIKAWIGYSTTDNDPSISAGWTWVPAGHNTLCGTNCGFPTENNDEYFADIGSSLPPGTYYYASRFTIDDPNVYYYGGWSGAGGGFWNNTYAAGSTTDHFSGELIITPVPCNDLIISEYVEGSSNNKYLEIYNPTASSINLSNYSLWLYTNGSSTATTTSALSGTLASGATVVYKNSAATAYSGTSTSLSAINFNGNDAIALIKNPSAIIDVIGQIGFDPGDGIGWTGGSASTVNRTLVRKSTIEYGDYNGPNTFNPNLEWNVYPIDDVSDLGFHFNDCIPSRELQLQMPTGLNISCGDSYTYSTTIINNNNDVVMRIQNLGSLSLTINSLSFTTGTHYTLVSPPATPFSITGNSYQDITIRFNPTTIGLLLDTLTISNNDASESICSIDLSGISESDCSTTTIILAAQDFESLPSDTWNYTAIHDGTSFPNNWGINTSLQFPDITSVIAGAQSGTYFWGITDLERAGHTNQPHQLSFTYSGLNAFDNAQLSFYYYTIGVDNSDGFEYELFYDSVSQGIVDISADNDAWTEVLINIPNSVNNLQLKFYADLDAQYDLAGIDNIELTSTTINTTTWTAGGWSPSTPDINTVAIIDSDYTTNVSNGNFSACNLIVNSGKKLIIADNYFIEVENNLTVNGNIIVQPKGAFIQNNDNGTVTVANKTSITVEKETAPMNQWYEYTYWSSPVKNETISEGLSDASINRRFWFDAQYYRDSKKQIGNGNLIDGQDDIDDYAPWDWQTASGIMQSGVGYASTHDAIIFNSSPGPLPRKFKYTFEGPFNNGIITVPIYRNDDEKNDNNWNFLGNPYPSAISADSLLLNNLSINKNVSYKPAKSGFIEGAIFFWSQNTEPSTTNSGNQNKNFSQDDYAIISMTGVIAGGDGVTPSRFIPSGQGFFIAMDDSAIATEISPGSPIKKGTVTFTNSMRMADGTSNNQFFRTNGGSSNKSKKLDNKLWVNLTSDNGVFNQIAVGYVNYATNAYDGMGYDTPRNLSNPLYSSIYTLISGHDKKFAIQGKDPNSLNLDEVIPLGFDTAINEATIYTLSVENVEGDFLTSNPIYLKDNFMNVVHNLSESDYTFTSEVGEFKDRFEIVFQSETLSDIEAQLNIKNLSIIELKDGRVQFKTNTGLTIQSIKIIDTLGRTLYQLKGSNTTEIYNLDNLSQSAYIAKIELSNGQIVTKKAIKRR